MKIEDIERIAIIGAGTMGAGISLIFAKSGYDVNLHDVNSQQLDLALERIQRSLELFQKEGLILPEKAKISKSKITIKSNLEESLDRCHFVLETVPEKLALKQGLFKQFESLCPVDTILATNTSGLSITSIASVCKHPERVGGMQWSNPAEFIPLVEVVRGEKTSDEVMETIYKLTEKLEKIPVAVQKDIPGFVGNRLQFAILREALHLVESGVISPKDVDRTLKGGFGFRYPWLGPLETADLGGLDVFYSISKYLFKELSTMSEPPEFFQKLIKEGKFGIKSGRGFYDYEKISKEEILSKRDLYFIRQLKLINEIKK